MKVFILLLLFASLASADAMIFNGFNTSEFHIGVMAADSNFSNELAKGTVSEGQPISINGTTGSIAGQISYLSMEGGNVSAPVIPPVIIPPVGGGGAGGGGIGNLFTCPDATVLAQCSKTNVGYLCTVQGLMKDSRCDPQNFPTCGNGICEDTESSMTCLQDCGIISDFSMPSFNIALPSLDFSEISFDFQGMSGFTQEIGNIIGSFVNFLSKEMTNIRDLSGFRFTFLTLTAFFAVLFSAHEFIYSRWKHGAVSLLGALLFISIAWQYIFVV